MLGATPFLADLTIGAAASSLRKGLPHIVPDKACGQVLGREERSLSPDAPRHESGTQPFVGGADTDATGLSAVSGRSPPLSMRLTKSARPWGVNRAFFMDVRGASWSCLVGAFNFARRRPGVNSLGKNTLARTTALGLWATNGSVTHGEGKRPGRTDPGRVFWLTDCLMLSRTIRRSWMAGRRRGRCRQRQWGSTVVAGWIIVGMQQLAGVEFHAAVEHHPANPVCCPVFLA